MTVLRADPDAVCAPCFPAYACAMSPRLVRPFVRGSCALLGALLGLSSVVPVRGAEPPEEDSAPVAPAAPEARPARLNRGGVIVRGERVFIIPPSAARAHRTGGHAPRALLIEPAPPTPPAPPDAAEPAPGPERVVDPAVARIEAHARAAEAHAYQHFRYRYRVGGTHYAVTSLHIVLEETEEVPGWGRFRSVGEAGIEYADGAGFRRAVRRFEVITGDRNGRPVGIEIELRH